MGGAEVVWPHSHTQFARSLPFSAFSALVPYSSPTPPCHEDLRSYFLRLLSFLLVRLQKEALVSKGRNLGVMNEREP